MDGVGLGVPSSILSYLTLFERGLGNDRTSKTNRAEV